jgi:hypothetical protein
LKVLEEIGKSRERLRVYGFYERGEISGEQRFYGFESGN